MNETQPQPIPQKRGGSWIYIILAVVLVWLLASSMGACDTKMKRESLDTFRADLGVVNMSATDYKDKFQSRALTDIPTTEIEDNNWEEIPANGSVYAPTGIVRAIVQQGNDFYVLLKGNKATVAEFQKDPKKGNYYFRCDQTYDISELWNEYNNFVGEQYAILCAPFGGVGADPKILFNDTEREAKNTYITYARNYYWDNNLVVDPQAVPESWFNLSNLLSLASIIILAIVAYFIFRSFSSRGGLGNMGRNSATHTMGGAVRFENVAGIEEEKEEVMEIVEFLRNPQKFLELGARIPKGVLLVGQPGTGKTLLAKAIAGEAGVHFFSISGSDFSEMLVGVGPSRMRDLFETAKANAPAIIFIDEIDSIARMRGVGASGVSDENEQTLNQLLVQMDGFTKSEGVIVIAATNRPDVLDQALLRPGRFDRQIVVQMPDVKGREQILRVHAKGKPLSGDVDLKRVSQIISGFSGADIENLLNESAIIAAKKNKHKITMADISEGINKVLLGPQKKSRIITDSDKKITAYHESGHAIVSRILEPDQVVQEVSIIPRGMAAGYTLTNEKDDSNHHQSKKQLTNRLAMLMAGRVAEKMFIGDTCTGSSNDMKVATDLAERMVTMFGMSTKIGPVYYGKEEEIALRLYNAQNPRSEAIQSIIDGEIKSLIEAAEKSAIEILTKEKSKAEVMTAVLLDRETIYADDITLIMNGKKEKDVMAEIDKRDATAREQEAKDKLEEQIQNLNNELDEIMKFSKRFIEFSHGDPKTLEKLAQNFEMARQFVRDGNVLPETPTIDNIDNYDKILLHAKEKTEK